MRDRNLSERECRAISRAVKEIRRHGCRLSKQQISTLCGQTKAGNPDAAMRGLRKLLDEKGVAYG